MITPVGERSNMDGMVVEAVAVDPPRRHWWQREQRLLIRYESGRVAVVELRPEGISIELAAVQVPR